MLYFSALVSSGPMRSQNVYDVKGLPLQYGSQVKYEHWSNTDKNIFDQIRVFILQKAFFFFKNHFKEVLCSLDIQTDKPNSPLQLQR